MQGTQAWPGVGGAGLWAGAGGVSSGWCEMWVIDLELSTQQKECHSVGLTGGEGPELQAESGHRCVHVCVHVRVWEMRTPETSPARCPGALLSWVSAPSPLCPLSCALPRVFHQQRPSRKSVSEAGLGSCFISAQRGHNSGPGHMAARGSSVHLGAWASGSAGGGEGTGQEAEGGGWLKAAQARKQTLGPGERSRRETQKLAVAVPR